MKKTKILILAAGAGTRIGGDIPKVLIPLDGKPMIARLLEGVSSLMIDIGIVVGHRADDVKGVLGSLYDYYFQERQLGTGHAVQVAKEALEREGIERLIVLYGDHPFVSAKSIRSLLSLQEQTSSPLCMMSLKLQNFDDWHQIFFYWGRILRDSGGKIKAIRECKDCTAEEVEITEVNPGMYVFETQWLWNNLFRLKNNNVQGEYYLTDLVEVAISQGFDIPTIYTKPKECVGVNSPEDLELARRLLLKKI